MGNEYFANEKFTWAQKLKHGYRILPLVRNFNLMKCMRYTVHLLRGCCCVVSMFDACTLGVVKMSCSCL